MGRKSSFDSLPNDIIDYIIDEYTYQRAFDYKPKITQNKMRKVKKQSSHHQDYDYLFKFVLIGNSQVGKTSLYWRFCDGVFNSIYYQHYDIDFRIRTIDIDDVKIRCLVYDTYGQERFRTITQSYYGRANGILMVYDITNNDSFENIKYWNQEIEKYASRDVTKIVI